MTIEMAISKRDERFLISDADYELVKDLKWAMNPYGYITSSQTIYLSRLIMNPSPNQVVDHINGNPLDNRRENLRLATVTQNAQNAKPQRRKISSRYKGVYRAVDNPQRFLVKINISTGSGATLARKQVALKGSFTNEVEAAKAYDLAALKYYGRFAWLNFPDEPHEIPTDEQVLQNVSDEIARVRPRKKSKYLGVQNAPQCPSRWTAGIRVDGKRKYLGCFETELEAAKAYDVAAKQLGKRHNNLIT